MPHFHFRSRHQSVSLLSIVIGCIILAAVIRFAHLGSIPHGMTWDEAAIGYNGYAVITTRRDEWLHKLPVSFQSFGDYKAPAAIYLNGLFTTLFGLELFVVRLPFALAGIAAVAAFGYLVYLLAEESNRRWQVGVGTLLLATVPWHVQYSRIGFESGIALSLFLIGLVSWLSFRSHFEKLGRWSKLGLFFVTISTWVATLYTYHSAKLFLPLFLLWLGWTERRWLWSHWKWTLGGSITGLLMLLPLIQDSLFGPGATRAGVLITNQGYALATVVVVFLKNTAAHLNPQFLVLGQTDSFRHGNGVWGVLSPVGFILLLFALFAVVRQLFARSFKPNAVCTYGVVFVVLGILPAALSAEAVPHSNRALFALPGYVLLSMYGAEQLLYYSAKKIDAELSFRLVIGMVLLLESLFFIAYWHDYTSRYARVSATDFQDGYIAAMALAQEYERGENGRPEVKQIVMSDTYGQPYIFALFVRKTSPIAYRGGSLNKYLFLSNVSRSDLERDNTLVIGTPESGITPEEATHVVYGSDGSVRFVLKYTGNHAQ